MARRESEADKRARALRDSGYTGPIDQNGHENHDHDDVFEALNRHSRENGVPGYGN